MRLIARKLYAEFEVNRESSSGDIPENPFLRGIVSNILNSRVEVYSEKIVS